jgi:hypothetical protein
MSRLNRARSTWGPPLERLPERLEGHSAPAPSVVVAALLLSVVGVRLALSAANNAPGPLSGGLAVSHDLLTAAGPTAIGVLVVPLAVAHRDRWVRAGLGFAGVFGLLGLHVPAAALPAAIGVVAGTLVVVVGARRSGASARTLAVSLILWLGLAASLSSATGIVDPSFRPMASLVVLAGVAALPLVRRPGMPGWVAGGATAAVVVWSGAGAPFVTGAVVLVGFGVVGQPLLAVAVAAGGGVAALGGALSGRRWQAALGVALLVLAGVPATIPDAHAAGAGLALLLGGGSR